MDRSFQFTLILCAVFQFSCHTESDQNKEKRNENWAWWVDDNSGKGMWIPIVNESTVENGKYTLFYFNGNVYEKGTMRKKKNVDTTFFHDLSGKCYGYKLNVEDSDFVYYYRDGNYKIYYSDGNVNSVGTVTNHRRGDQWKVFYKDGNISVDRNLKNGVGFTTHYYKNGKKKSVLYCDYSLDKDFYTREWYENGQLAYAGDLKGGKYDGILKRYYQNGRLKKCWEMRSGVHHGALKEYYENGQIKQDETVVDGLVQGKVETWYESGQLKAIANKKDDKFDGFQQHFYENGNPKFTAWAKKGAADGEVRNYDLSGKLTSIEIYSNGKKIKSLNTLSKLPTAN